MEERLEPTTDDMRRQ